MLNRYVVPFNRNIYKSKLHFDNRLVWNSLPEKGCCCDSLYTFRRQVKIHNHNQVPNAVNIQNVSALEWVIMEEKQSERYILSIDVEEDLIILNYSNPRCTVSVNHKKMDRLYI